MYIFPHYTTHPQCSRQLNFWPKILATLSYTEKNCHINTVLQDFCTKDICVHNWKHIVFDVEV